MIDIEPLVKALSRFIWRENDFEVGENEGAPFAFTATNVNQDADDEFSEELHPRVPAGEPGGGQFGAGGGGETSHTKDETAALKTYSGSEFEDINAHFREGDSIGPRLTGVVKNMDSAFAKASLPHDTTAFRVVGDNGFAKMQEAFSKGQHFSDASYVSTTASEDSMREFGKLLNKHNTVEIRVPKGAKAIDMSKLSEHPGEKELLLNRGSRFRVTSITGRHAVVELVQ